MPRTSWFSLPFELKAQIVNLLVDFDTMYNVVRISPELMEDRPYMSLARRNPRCLIGSSLIRSNIRIAEFRPPLKSVPRATDASEL